MLQYFRNAARGPAGKIIVAVIVVAFAFFGAESIVSIANNTDPVEVNGEGISSNQIQSMVNRRQQQLMQQLGENATPELLNSGFIRQSVINSLINEELQRQATDNLGFAVSSEQVSQDIVSIPAFQVDGQFDEQTYRRLIAQNGFTPNTFRAQRGTELQLTQMQSGLVASAFSLDREVARVAELENQQREIAYRSYQAEDFTDQTEVTQADIQSYYDANSSDYLSPERVRVRYVRLSQADIAAQMVVSEDELQAAYERYVAEQESDTSREIAHILFANSEDNQAAAQAALQRLNQGESFEQLAAELSDDPASAQDGGYLGELTEGVFADDFYQAAQDLSEVGQVTGPVESEFGYHLIRLESFSAAEVEPLAEVRDDLEDQVRRDKAAEEFVLIENQLADQAFQSDEIATVAETFDTEVRESGWITRDAQSGLGADPAFNQAAFSPVVVDDGRISDVARLQNGDLAVAQLEEYQPEQVQPLAEVRDRIEQQLVAQQARTLAMEAAEAEMQAVRASGSLPESGWQVPGVIARDNEELPSALVEFSFAMPRPDSGGLTVERRQGQDRIDLVAVLNVRDGEATADQRQQLDATLAQRNGQLEYQSFFSGLRAGADIQIRNSAQQDPQTP